MRSVDIVYPGKLSSPIGPSQIIKRVASSLLFFKENNIDLKVYSVDESVHGSSTKMKQALKSKGFLIEFLYDLVYIVRLELKRFLFIWRYIKKNRYPEVVVFDHVTSFLYFVLLRKNSYSRIVLFQHTNGRISDMGKARFSATARLPHVALIERLFYSNLHKLSRIVFISKNAHNVFVKEHPNFKEKACFIVNGIPDLKELTQYKFTNNKIKLITVGTLTKRKGADIVIKALGKLPQSIRSRFTLSIVGDGPDKLEFKSLTRGLGLDPQVTFEGKKSQPEVIKLLSDSNVYVQMSLSEGLPLALLEALRAKLPIITSDVGGCSETVSNDNGYLVNPDSDELAEKLKGLSIERLENMSEKSRELFESDFHFDTFIKKYTRLLLEV